ncbi:GTP-binding protein HflX [Tranquillimonas alkanivorans]|uniref:GTPase HflX n=1 Tax=Tranquillimonas alkanivorans TaxID=441119 RepID=A0A1I5RPD3_9RHOB|nr:GTPase HflX [Tranquillimonas alkanivorans]SFP60378.1 GTP-binding protein HflX [Tranquillimonas alkanivorans]
MDTDTGAVATRAYVLHPDLTSDRERRDPEPALAEAIALAEALPDLEVLGGEVVRLRKPDAGALFGSGKLDELMAKLSAQEVGLVLVDGPVSPVQQRNLEKAWGVKVLDRTGLILEIFSDRAATREGVLQVEMAALSYQRTRLVRAWTHLERQRGGLGFVGGPGETQIEADRRAIDEQLTRLRRQLDKVAKTRELHRASRAKVPFPVVALVGYTNAGKSTLFNRLTGAEVMAKDMLFATLDPTMRGVTLPTGMKVILSDTVGFISDLPTQLVAAFRATLEEVLSADLILHVRDITHPETEGQKEDVMSILHDLGVAEDVPMIEVWNKVDVADPERRAVLQTVADRTENVRPLSAVTGEGLDGLIEAITHALDDARTVREIELPFEEGRKRAWLHEQGVVMDESQTETGFRLTVAMTARQEKRFREL